MSIDSIAREIANVVRDINSIERSTHPIDANINRKQKEAHSLLDKIAREKDLKRMIGYQKDLTKKNEEISKLEKDKSTKAKALADKQKRDLNFKVCLPPPHKQQTIRTKDRRAVANSGLACGAVLADSFVLRNSQLHNPANRWDGFS